MRSLLKKLTVVGVVRVIPIQIQIQGWGWGLSKNRRSWGSKGSCHSDLVSSSPTFTIFTTQLLKGAHFKVKKSILYVHPKSTSTAFFWQSHFFTNKCVIFDFFVWVI